MQLSTSFSGWSGGGCSGTATSCTIKVNALKEVTAKFESTKSIADYLSDIEENTGLFGEKTLAEATDALSDINGVLSALKDMHDIATEKDEVKAYFKTMEFVISQICPQPTSPQCLAANMIKGYLQIGEKLVDIVKNTNILFDANDLQYLTGMEVYNIQVEKQCSWYSWGCANFTGDEIDKQIENTFFYTTDTINLNNPSKKYDTKRTPNGNQVSINMLNLDEGDTFAQNFNIFIGIEWKNGKKTMIPIISKVVDIDGGKKQWNVNILLNANTDKALEMTDKIVIEPQ